MKKNKPTTEERTQLPEVGSVCSSSSLLHDWPLRGPLVLHPWPAVAACSEIDADFFFKVMINVFTPISSPGTVLLPCPVSVLGWRAVFPRPSAPRAQCILCICCTTSGLWWPPSHIPHPWSPRRKFGLSLRSCFSQGCQKSGWKSQKPPPPRSCLH